MKENCSNVSETDNDMRNNLVLLPNSLHNIQTKQSNGTSVMGEFAANSQITKTLSKFTKGSFSKKEVSPLRKMSTFETINNNCELVDEKGKGNGNELRKARSVNAGYNRKQMKWLIVGGVNGSGNGVKRKGGKKVEFVDEKFYIPLVEVVDVQSYKKYNVNENESEEGKNGGCGGGSGSSSGRGDNKKNVCCVIE
jgi:hypothetical protein